jgi:hypothetical protein
VNKERELAEFRKHRNALDNDNWHGFYWHWMDEFNGIVNRILSDKLIIASNLDEDIQNQCMRIVKHAFVVHSKPELIRNFITNNVHTPNPFGEWKCLIYRDHILGNDLKLINWDNILYLHAFDVETIKCAKIFIYYLEPNAIITESGGRLFSYPPIEVPQKRSIIINEFNCDITDSLFGFIEAQKSHILNANNDEDSEPISQSEYTYNLEILRVIVGDERAFYYISKETKFLFYYEHFISESFTQLMINCKCKFAVMIGEIRFAVFTYSHSRNDESKLQLSFMKNNDDVSQIRMTFRNDDFSIYKYWTHI